MNSLLPDSGAREVHLFWPLPGFSRLDREIDTSNVLKDPDMLKRLNDLNELSDLDKDGILYALDGLLRDAKARKTYGR